MPDTINSIIAFRCPASMNERMKASAAAKGQRLSAFIRSACAEVLRRQPHADEPFTKTSEVGRIQ